MPYVRIAQHRARLLRRVKEEISDWCSLVAIFDLGISRHTLPGTVFAALLPWFNLLSCPSAPIPPHKPSFPAIT